MSNVLPCQVKFTIFNKEPGAQRQRAHCLESAAGKGWRQSQVCLSVRLRLPSWGGQELMRPLLGNSSETPAIGLLLLGCSISSTFNAPLGEAFGTWISPEHFTITISNYCTCGQPRAARRSSKAAQQRGAGWAAEPPPGAPWLSRLPAEDCPVYASVCACSAGLRDRPPRSPVAGWAFPLKLVCWAAWSLG